MLVLTETNIVYVFRVTAEEAHAYIEDPDNLIAALRSAVRTNGNGHVAASSHRDASQAAAPKARGAQGRARGQYRKYTKSASSVVCPWCDGKFKPQGLGKHKRTCPHRPAGGLADAAAVG